MPGDAPSPSDLRFSLHHAQILDFLLISDSLPISGFLPMSGFLSITQDLLFSQRWGPSSDGYQHHVAIRALWEQPEHLLLFKSYRSARGFVTQSRNVCWEMRGTDILSARERRRVSRRIALGWLFLAVLHGPSPPPRKKESKEPAISPRHPWVAWGGHPWVRCGAEE